MASLPKKKLVDLIDAVEIESFPRKHLGASVIAHPCQRKSVYSFRWAHKVVVDARRERIFRTGDFVEDQLVAALKSIGLTVYGSQDKIHGYQGHGGGSIDGLISLVPGYEEFGAVLFEAKSMNHTNFLNLIRKGVQEAFPSHYGQVNKYMGALGVILALYMALDKDTSKIHIEMVPFDVEEYERLCDVERNVIDAMHINEFPRISDNPSWYQCKTCEGQGVCQKGDQVERNCRTCQYVSVESRGHWACTLHSYIDVDMIQEEGCGDYELGAFWK
jgi:hypothetical protein